MREKLKKEKEEVRGPPSFRVHNGPLTRARFLNCLLRRQREAKERREAEEKARKEVRLVSLAGFPLRCAVRIGGGGFWVPSPPPSLWGPDYPSTLALTRCSQKEEVEAKEVL